MAGVLPVTLRARFARSNLLPANLSNLNNQLHLSRPANEKSRLFLAKATFFLMIGRGERMERQLRCLACGVCRPAMPVSV